MIESSRKRHTQSTLRVHDDNDTEHNATITEEPTTEMKTSVRKHQKTLRGSGASRVPQEAVGSIPRQAESRVHTTSVATVKLWSISTRTLPAHWQTRDVFQFKNQKEKPNGNKEENLDGMEDSCKGKNKKRSSMTRSRRRSTVKCSSWRS